eukprot:m.96488 g.96488  ORF g.96488 m.96488 type:complete len:197 (+) comp12467_c0_seq6:48-638(+)
MNNIARSLTHPSEVIDLLSFQFLGGKEKLFPKRGEVEMTESWEKCDYFLTKTSRSFSAVIKALDVELRPAISVFYLVLRGLDTVEDDMTLNSQEKQTLLTSFHEKLYEKGWTFDGSGENEKDRQLLVEFNVVIEEFLRLDEPLQNVIADICKKMGAGMVEFIHKVNAYTLAYIVRKRKHTFTYLRLSCFPNQFRRR